MNAPNHGILQIKQGRHATVSMTFATSTDRLADNPTDAPARFIYPFTEEDVGRVVKDLDTGALLILGGVSPILWNPLSLQPDPNSIDIQAVKSTPGSIAGGSAVRIIGFSVSESLCTVEEAKADSSSTMPALGITVSGLTEGTPGLVRVTGLVQGLDTSSFLAGDIIYVSDTVSGGLKNTRPEGATEVQPIAQICASDVVVGSMIVTGTARQNSLPNLSEGFSWIGGSNGIPLQTIDLNNQDLKTGVITGFLMTINAGDNTKFDIAAGVGVHISWLTGKRVITLIETDPIFAVSVPDHGVGRSEAYINSSGNPVVISGVLITPQQRRDLIRLQSIISLDLVTITLISKQQTLAYQGTEGILDFIDKLGPVNQGNEIFAASTDLTIGKNAGVTTKPDINTIVDNQDPSNQTDPAIPVLNPVIYSHRNGLGGFTADVSNSAFVPNHLDEGTGLPLGTIPNNRYSNTRCFHIPDGNLIALCVPQDHYGTQSEAIAAIPSESKVIDPSFDIGVLTTIIVCKSNTSDLSVPADAVFLVNF